MSLDDRVAIVWGGGRGAGRAIAHALSQAGAAVLILDADAEAGEEVAADIRKAGRPASFAQSDPTDEVQAARVVQMARAKSGRVDVLVNASGVTGAAGFIRLVLSAMTPHNWGAVINVASDADAEQVTQLTREVSSELAGSNVHCTAIIGVSDEDAARRAVELASAAFA